MTSLNVVLAVLSATPRPTPITPLPEVDSGAAYKVEEDSNLRLEGKGWDEESDGTFEVKGWSVTFDAMGLRGPSTRRISFQVMDLAAR